MIFIVAGGTGGHLFPAIALAEAYQKEHSVEEILLIGTLTPIDKEIYQKSGFSFELLPFHRPRSGIIGKIKLAIELLNSFLKSYSLIKEQKPELIVACGGFGCLPLSLVAKYLKVPLILLEQNVIPGRMNRFLSNRAKFIFTEFKEAEPYFKDASKVIHLGNPIRHSIKNIGTIQNQDTILFMGGSQGASKINEAAFSMIPELVQKYPNLQIVHLTGSLNFDKYKENEKHSQVKVRTFMDNMEEVYRRTKLIICRSGATSIAEIAALGIPSIFIPYPYAKDDHQKANAKVLADIKASVLLEEKDLSEDSLKKEISALLENSDSWKKMSDVVQNWAKPNAGENIIAFLKEKKLLH